MSDAVAVVDCGTNTARLLIRRDGVDVLRRAEVTNLGRGVDRSGRLDPDGIAMALTILGDYRDRCVEEGVTATRVLATSAARDADNADELLGPIVELFGVEPEVLSGDDEARLSFEGAIAGVGGSETTLVVDIGGGSTEFAVGAGHFEGGRSIDIGSRRLTERYVEYDPPRPEELSAMLSVVEAFLDDVAIEVPLVGAAERLVGVAGTVTTMAAVEIGLLEWDRDRVHGFVLTREAAEDVFRTLATEALEDRIHNPGLLPDRADVIVAGCCILLGVMRKFGFDECVVSDADLLDGAVAALEAT
ncbi:MAG: exopolyphosphatase [Actinomycetota bacterium]